MKLFIDTANLEEIREAASWGIIDGVTTNPSLVAKELGGKKSFREIVEEICRMIDGPVSAEVTNLDTDGMVKEARELAAIHENVVIKIPMTIEGIKAVQQLSSEGIRTNVTLVFSASQAMLAAKAGASFVSPFVGRIDDRSGDGMEVVAEILEIFANYGFETEVIVASVRHPRHVLEAALLGADIATVPFAVLKKLFEHPLTDLGLEVFLADWERGQRLS
jgi:transaldolase